MGWLCIQFMYAEATNLMRILTFPVTPSQGNEVYTVRSFLWYSIACVPIRRRRAFHVSQSNCSPPTRFVRASALTVAMIISVRRWLCPIIVALCVDELSFYLHITPDGRIGSTIQISRDMADMGFDSGCFFGARCGSTFSYLRMINNATAGLTVGTVYGQIYVISCSEACHRKTLRSWSRRSIEFLFPHPCHCYFQLWQMTSDTIPRLLEVASKLAVDFWGGDWQWKTVSCAKKYLVQWHFVDHRTTPAIGRVT